MASGWFWLCLPYSIRMWWTWVLRRLHRGSGSAWTLHRLKASKLAPVLQGGDPRAPRESLDISCLFSEVICHPSAIYCVQTGVFLGSWARGLTKLGHSPKNQTEKVMVKSRRL